LNLEFIYLIKLELQRVLDVHRVREVQRGQGVLDVHRVREVQRGQGVLDVHRVREVQKEIYLKYLNEKNKMDFQRFLVKQVQNCYKLSTFQNTGQSCILGNSKVQHRQIKKKSL